MPRNDDIRIRRGTAAPVGTDFNLAEPAWDATAGVFYVKASSGEMIRVGPFSLPVATASTLGGVKIGSGVSVDANGVISVSGGGGGTTTDASSLTSGTLADARLSSNAQAAVNSIRGYAAAALFG
jgi:hypothetical protein